MSRPQASAALASSAGCGCRAAAIAACLDGFLGVVYADTELAINLLLSIGLLRTADPKQREAKTNKEREERDRAVSANRNQRPARVSDGGGAVRLLSPRRDTALAGRVRATANAVRRQLRRCGVQRAQARCPGLCVRTSHAAPRGAAMTPCTLTIDVKHGAAPGALRQVRQPLRQLRLSSSSRQRQRQVSPLSDPGGSFRCPLARPSRSCSSWYCCAKMLRCNMDSSTSSLELGLQDILCDLT